MAPWWREEAWAGTDTLSVADDCGSMTPDDEGVNPGGFEICDMRMLLLP